MAGPDEHYDASFFRGQVEPSSRSAAVVVPYVVNLVRPTSVVDVGCGSGTWLAQFIASGVEDVVGVDGYAPPNELRFPVDRFRAHDLTTPIDLGRTFDLVVSLEVAEHLPASSSEAFVDVLVGLGSTVLFSAAVPKQGGNEHINERWQDEWRELFRARGFVASDAVRTALWCDTAVEPYYLQNVVVYVRGDRLDDASTAIRSSVVPDERSLDVIHPRFFLEKVTAAPTMRTLVTAIPLAIRNAVTHRIGRRSAQDSNGTT